MTNFISGRSGQGASYVSDRSGSPHARFLHLTSYALMPLGPLAAWYLAKASGAGLEGVKAAIGHPFPALVLVAFVAIAMPHARAGMDEIITDYVREPRLKEQALIWNRRVTIAVAAAWILGVMLIAAP